LEEEKHFTPVWNQTGVPRCPSLWRRIPTEPSPPSKAQFTYKRRKLKLTAAKMNCWQVFVFGSEPEWISWFRSFCQSLQASAGVSQ
jgi:hypothetical protein